MCNAFNDTQNSSTICEFGTAILANGLPVVFVAHVAIVNKGVATMGAEILDQMEKRQATELRAEKGAIK